VIDLTVSEKGATFGGIRLILLLLLLLPHV
jgi:hypothetical protein